MTRIAAAVLLLATVAGCGVAAGPRAAAPQARTLAARAASGFHDLAGKPASLTALQDKAVVVSFLTPDEAGSDAQLPILIRLADAYAAEGVAFVVSGEKASAAMLKSWSVANDLQFPVWEDRGASEWKARGFGAVPAHEFRRRGGGVMERHEGFMSRGELTEHLEELVHAAR